MTIGELEAREELQAVARKLLGAESPPIRVRSVVDEPGGFDRELWLTMADLGWLGIAVPAELGGAGGSFADLMVVLTELGRHVVPGPFFSTVVLGASALLQDGGARAADEIAELVSGRLLVALVTGLVSGGGGPVLESGGGGHRLSGTAACVADADIADLLVVAAHHGDDPKATSLVRVPMPTSGVDVQVLPSIDGTRRLCSARFDDVAVGRECVLGELGQGGVVLDWLIDKAAAALAADCLGGAERVLELTVDYAKKRVQFGRPIGTFQAIKHRCADMLLMVEASRAAVEDAAESSAARAGGFSPEAAIAKSYAGDAYALIAREGIQLHGGIGFTWEHDLHLFFKRAKLNQVWYGDSAWHRRRLARHLLGLESWATPS
jgi:alkylation response protein AidB-like acyl-CoA dehydrogenase